MTTRSTTAAAVLLAAALAAAPVLAIPAAAATSPNGVHAATTATAVNAATTATAVNAATTATAVNAATTGTAVNDVHANLPALPGRLPVGEVSLHLVDQHRADPFHPDQRRELMVSVWYPARDTGHHPSVPYMLPAAAAHFDSTDLQDYLGFHLPTGKIDWAATGTHTALGAPVDRGHAPRPVVLYSGGLGEPRTWGSTVVRDLASRGYVVVTIDNTYDSPEVQFPDGSLREPNYPSSMAGFTAFLRTALPARVADTSFVLDQLTALNAGHNPDVDGTRLPAGLVGALDLDHVGMLGHSFGGSATAESMYADPRITAGINLDGNLAYADGTLLPSAAHGLHRPLLLLGKDDRLSPTDTGPGWQAFLANTPGWHKYLILTGAVHATYTDAEALEPALAKRLGVPAAQVTADIGTIAPADALRYTDVYVSAFFDKWLRGKDNHLLDGPNPAFPLMRFQS